MALWQLLPTDEVWDDGLTAKPGEDSFSTELVTKKAGVRNFNYIGTPNWQAPIQIDEVIL